MNVSPRFTRLTARATNLPMFWLTPDESQSAIFRRASQDLGVVCLRSPPIDSTKPPLTLKQLAVFYADSIAETGIPQPFVLAGYCIAAVLAREVAIELDKRGVAVHSLVMFDPPDPALSQSAVSKDSWARMLVSLFWRVAMHITRIVQQSPREVCHHFRESVAGIQRRMTYQRSRSDYRHAHAANIAARQTNAFMLSVGAYLNSSLEIYRGSAFIVRPADAPKAAYINADRRWQSLIAGRVSVVTVPGNTSTMWQEPLVSHTAQCLMNCLEQ